MNSRDIENITYEAKMMAEFQVESFIQPLSDKGKNKEKQYEPFIRQYLSWVRDTYVTDEFINEKRLLRFLKEVVIQRKRFTNTSVVNSQFIKVFQHFGKKFCCNASFRGGSIEAGNLFALKSTGRSTTHYFCCVICILNCDIDAQFPADWNLTNILFTFKNYGMHYSFSHS